MLLDGDNIYANNVDPVDVRRTIGMVFQRPNPFPTMSIYDNVVAGLKLQGGRMKKSDLDNVVEKSLRGANLWEEVKDRLPKPGAGLSGGQQQRLCIARAIAVEPQVLLMDEPCSALDPISTLAIEDLIQTLKEKYTIVIVTHNMQQAARVSERTAFFNLSAVGKTGSARRDGRHREDLLQPERPAHRGLHLRPLRIGQWPTEFDPRSGGAFTPMSSLPKPHEHDIDSEDALSAGDVEMNIAAHTAAVHGHPIALSPQEFRLLALLLRHVDRVLPSKYLLDELWGPNFTGDPGTLNVHILRIRTKLERHPGASAHIRTVRGVGYIFDSTPQSSDL